MWGHIKKAKPSTLMLKRRHSHRMEAEWSSQSSFKGRYCRHRGGRNVAHTEGLSFAVERIYYMAIIGWPFCIHSATTAMPLRPLCLIWATIERPTSSATLLRLFWTRSKLDGDHGVHGDCWTSCVPPLNDQGNHAASFERPMATWSVLWSHKGGINKRGPWSLYSSNH